MFGFFFGALCLMGMMGMARRAFWAGRYAGAYGHGCHGGHGPWHGRGWHGWHGGHRGGGRGRGRPDWVGDERFSRAASEILKRRLGIDEEQEPMVDHALNDLRTALKELGEELNASRQGLADALRGETVDDAGLSAVFARHDDAVGRARRQVVSAVKQIHAVLEPDQRAKAADWIASSAKGWV